MTFFVLLLTGALVVEVVGGSVGGGGVEAVGEKYLIVVN